MAYWQGDYDEASVAYADSLAVWRELGDRRGTAEVLRSLGYLAGIRGDFDDAHALHEESRAISDELDDLCSVAHDLVGDGMIHHVEGHAETAQASFEEACRLFEQLGERYGLASALCLLSRILVERGDPGAAQERWCRAFQLLRELGDGSGMIIALSDLSAIELAFGNAETAVRLAGAADGLSQALKLRPPTALTKPPDPRPAARRDIGPEAVDDAWQEGRAMTLAEAIAYADETTDLEEPTRPARRA
jgi:tetratricopeptide (TPR) repeat protein